MTSSIHKDPSNALSVSHSAADRFKTTDRSCQSLLSSLEDASLLSEDLCSHLAQHDLILTLGLDFYQSPSAESLALLKSPQLQLHSSKLSVCNDKELAFVLRLSAHLDLDQVQSLLILRAWVEKEVMAPAALRKLVWKGDVPYTDAMLSYVRDFYFHERLSSLFLIAALFRISYDPSHFHHDTALGCTKKLISTDLPDETMFYMRILSQLTAIGGAAIPTHFQSDPDLAHHWSSQNLEEQIALAEILILIFYNNVSCSPSVIQKVYTALYQCSFGVDQLNRSFFKETQHKRMSYLNHLCNIICAETFRFEHCITFSKYDDIFEDSNDIQLIPALSTEMEAIIWTSLRDRPSHLPGNFDALAILSWAVFQQVLILRTPTFPFASVRDYLTDLSDTSSISDHSPQRLLQHSYTVQNVFECLLHSLDQFPYHGKFGSYTALKSILKGVLMAFFTTQNVNSLPKQNVLVSCMAQLFSDESELCKQFWDEDYAIDERRSLLDCTRRHFPIEFSSFLELIGSLTASSATALIVFQYLSEITSFSDLLRPGYEPAPHGIFGEQFIWTGGSLVAYSRSVSFNAPVGTMASLAGRGAVIVNMHYSAWILFEVLLESFLFRPSHMDDQSSPGPLLGTGETTLKILKFLSTFFTHADKPTVEALMVHLGKYSLMDQHRGVPISGTIDKLLPEEHLVSLLSQILDRVCLQQVPNLDLVTYCINTIRLLVSHYPGLVWRHLRSQMLLPHFSRSPLLSQQPSTSYMQRSILPLERSLGTYSATNAFLQLFLDLLDDAQGTLQAKWSVIDPVDSHGLDSVRSTTGTQNSQADLASSSSSNHDDEVSRAEVILSILSFLIYEVFPNILGHVCWANVKLSEPRMSTSSMSTSAYSYEFLLDAFLQADSTQHVAALLETVGAGSESLVYLHRHHRSFEAKLLEHSVVESMRLIGHLVSCRIQLSLPTSVLETMLLDRTVKRHTGGPIDLVHVIGRYVFYEPNLSLALYAIHLLTLLCEATSAAHAKSVSFVGYFGNDAQAFADSLCCIVQNNVGTLTYNAELQDAVLHFATTTLKSQPGLSALLFASGTPSISDFYHPTSLTSVSKLPLNKDLANAEHSSMIHAILGILKNWKEELFIRPFVVTSCMRLLDLIWQSAPDHRTTLDGIRRSNVLWKILRHMVFTKLDDMVDESALEQGMDSAQNEQNQLTMCLLDVLRSFALHILTLEAYFSIGVSGISDSHRDMIRQLIVDAFQSKELLRPIYMGDEFPLRQNTFETLQMLVAQEHPHLNLSLYCMSRTCLLVDQSTFGRRYMFDINVLSKQFVAKNHEQYNGLGSRQYTNRKRILQKLVDLNWEWSRADSYMLLLQSAQFLVEVLCVQLWDTVWPRHSLQQESASTGESHAYYFIIRLACLLKNDNRTVNVVLRYRAICARMIRVLVIAWIRSKSTASGDSESLNATFISEHLELIDNIQTVLTAVSPFDLGPTGLLSSYEFHIELFMSLLLLMRSINRKCAAAKQSDALLISESKITDVCGPLVPFVCQAVSFVLSAELTDATSVHLRIGHALMIELVQRHELRSSIWLTAFDRFQIISLMLNIVSKADVRIFDLCSESFEMILSTILCISSNPRFAERLAVEGILTAFSSSAFASHMAQGYREPHTSAHASLRMQHSWGLVLSILTQMLDVLGHSPQFALELIGIVKLFLNSLLLAFEKVLAGPLLIFDMDDLEHAADLLFSLSQVLGSRSLLQLRQHEPELIASLKSVCLRVLSYFADLFANPLELASLCEFACHTYRTLCIGEVIPAQPEPKSIQEKMRRITRNLVLILLTTTNAEDLIMSGSNDHIQYTMGDLVLLPKMTSVRGETSSFSTLFNLIRKTLSYMETHTSYSTPSSSSPLCFKGRQETDRDICVQTIEGALLLILSQLFILQSLSENTEDISTELMQTLDDLKQALTPRASKPSPTPVFVDSSLEFVAFLCRICERRLRLK
ncbi:hypothetical protein BASA61_003548 [Batrachochytrium salamandrivorans]|nr:hypothetical protein BASA61_003548 [Batrachochytrium salamandrivorans]